jgi:hypothetical protein
MGSVAYQKGTMYCGARVRRKRRAVRALSKLERTESRPFSIHANARKLVNSDRPVDARVGQICVSDTPGIYELRT